MREFDLSRSSHSVFDLENFSIGCEKGPPTARFLRESILCRDCFSANLTEIDRYSPALAQNIPVFSEPWPESGSTALSGGQKGKKFPSQLRLSVRRKVRF